MTRKLRHLVFSRRSLPVWAACLLLGSAAPAHATQVHPGMEGLIVHQIAHLFFIISMGTLIYWLRGRELTREPGWRFVQYAAFFFILWNIDAMIAHYLDGRNDLFHTINIGAWHGSIELVEGPHALAFLYYLAKMDHLLCLPAVVFLYIGLRRLLKDAEQTRTRESAS